MSTSNARSLFVELDEADKVTLEHVARACGEPPAKVGGRLIAAALHADGVVSAVIASAEVAAPDDSDDDWPPTPAA